MNSRFIYILSLVLRRVSASRTTTGICIRGEINFKMNLNRSLKCTQQLFASSDWAQFRSPPTLYSEKDAWVVPKGLFAIG